MLTIGAFTAFLFALCLWHILHGTYITDYVSILLYHQVPTMPCGSEAEGAVGVGEVNVVQQQIHR